MGVAAISAPIDAGTSLNISVTFDGTMGNSVMIGVYNCVGINSGTAVDTDTEIAASNPITLNLDVQNGGVLIGGFVRYHNSGNSVTGETENYDATFSSIRGFGGSLAVVADESNRAVVFSTDTATALYGAAVAVSLR